MVLWLISSPDNVSFEIKPPPSLGRDFMNVFTLIK